MPGYHWNAHGKISAYLFIIINLLTGYLRAEETTSSRMICWQWLSGALALSCSSTLWYCLTGFCIAVPAWICLWYSLMVLQRLCYILYDLTKVWHHPTLNTCQNLLQKIIKILYFCDRKPEKKSPIKTEKFWQFKHYQEKVHSQRNDMNIYFRKVPLYR